MRLENLYENFGLVSYEKQLDFISLYRLKRAEDLRGPSTYPKRKSTKSTVKRSKIDLSLTDEEKALIKMLGIKQKDILALRAITSTDQNDIDTDTDSGTELLQDSIFSEEEY